MTDPVGQLAAQQSWSILNPSSWFPSYSNTKEPFDGSLAAAKITPIKGLLENSNKAGLALGFLKTSINAEQVFKNVFDGSTTGMDTAANKLQEIARRVFEKMDANKFKNKPESLFLLTPESIQQYVDINPSLFQTKSRFSCDNCRKIVSVFSGLKNSRCFPKFSFCRPSLSSFRFITKLDPRNIDWKSLLTRCNCKNISIRGMFSALAEKCSCNLRDRVARILPTKESYDCNTLMSLSALAISITTAAIVWLSPKN